MDMKSEIKIKVEELEYHSYDPDPQFFPGSDTDFASTNSIKFEEPNEAVYIKSELREIGKDSMLDEEQANNEVSEPEKIGTVSPKHIFIDVDAQDEDSKVESSGSRPLTSGTVDRATKKNCQNYFRCRVCNLTFKKLDELANHLKTHEQKKFKCTHCSYECNYKSSLKTHMQNHSNSKLFKCAECNYECNQKGHLKLHLLNHSNLKLFKCSECSFDCNRKSDLQRHLLIHSNSKLFKCSECSFECNQKGNLKAHLLSHSNLKLFKCSECNYECKQKRYLKIHIHKKHGTVTKK